MGANSKLKVDWYYFRKGCTTCIRASRFLEASQTEILETIPASRKLQAVDAASLLQLGTKLIAMKGKKITEFDLGPISDAAIAATLGPTGNMRAPTLRIGKTILVGFNEEVFKAQFS